MRADALTSPRLLRRLAGLLAASAAVAVAVLVLGGSPSYVLKLQMTDASGLRPGSQVLLGGVPVGTVNSLHLTHQNIVIANLHLNGAEVHVGRGATAQIVAANLLGEVYVALSPGDSSLPLPSSTTLPESATTLPTALDQIVDVFNGSTRARLAILLEDAGAAVAGRRSDVNAILRQLPLTLSAATSLLTTMVRDNHTLEDAVARSSQFIARVDSQSPDLKHVIGAAAGAATTLGDRAAALRQIVAGAPATLQTVRTFLTNLGSAADHLSEPVSELADDAPLLNHLLASVQPFTTAAVPTLDRAAAVAPVLTALARKATPTVTQAAGMAGSLQKVAGLAKPLSAWLGLSAQDLAGIPQGWARAIQYRDGLSHIFNANVYLSPSVVLNIADRGASAEQRCQNLLDVLQPGLLRAIDELGQARADRRNGCHGAAATTPRHHFAPAAATTPIAADGTGAPAPTVATPSTGNSGLSSLLGGAGKLLAGISSGVAGTADHATAPVTGTSDKTGSSLGALLNYLLGA